MRAPLLSLVRRASIALGILVAATAAAADRAPAAYEWLQGLSLVVLDSDDVGSLHAAHAHIRAAGGRIALLSPPSLLVGWIPPEAVGALVGRAHIRAVYDREVALHSLGLADPGARSMVEFFNAAVRGDIRPPAAIEKMTGWPATESDARPAEPLETWAYLRNLQQNGFDMRALERSGVLLGTPSPDGQIAGNSDRMTGTVTVTLLFVESDGTGADPNTYTWTPADVQSYVNGVNTGLVWWSATSAEHNNCWVAFFVRWVPPTDPRCKQWREMVLHPSGDVAAMASDIMAKFGYTAGGHLTRVNSFNTAQRVAYGTNWAYTGFVAYNPEPAPGQLSDGKAAFAYLFGPYTFLLFRSYGWRPDQVFTHESGHIFGACDEYASACTCGEICIDEPNGNCESCGGGVSCMMRANTFTICTYTDDQVGWQDASPCAPPALLPPTATSITPAAASQGTSLQVTIGGQNFLYGAFATFGDGVDVQSSTVIGTDSLQLQVNVHNEATPGWRNVVVSNRDLQSSTLVAAFEVRTTSRHYYAPTGGNVFPYHTPASAATSLADAIDAAASGDSVLVGTGTLPLGSFVLNKGVLLSGAWNAGFTARDLVNGKTLFDLTGNVYIAVSGGGTGGLDGFELRNGRGGAWGTPVAGHYGGAVSIISSSGLVANCDLHANQATTSGDFGGGGGIFASGSTVTLVDNTIHGNTATRGGGIYLHASTGAVLNNSITGNAVSASTLTPRGAGIVLDGCNNVTLVDNVVDGNTGAETAGGLYVLDSTGIAIQDGTIAHHTVSTNGGGAHFEASAVSCQNVRFAHNHSSWSAGGLAASGGGSLQLDGCEFLWNTAILYAGAQCGGPVAHVRHCLFVGNAGGYGGGLTLGTVASGSVLGNTFDRNAANGGGGSLMLTSAAVAVTNNILANTTGTAVFCSGTPPLVLDYNLAWQSSVAHYAGCTPGPSSAVSDPLFADTTRVDYHLSLHSPAIDAGRTDAGFADPDGSRGDLGRYGSHAFVMQQPSFPHNLTAQRLAGDVVLRWSANPEADVLAYAVYCDTTSGFRPATANFVTLVASPDTTALLAATACTRFTIAAVDTSGYASGYAVEAVLPPPTDSPSLAAWQFRLHPSTPNPFNPTTTVRFELDRPSRVRLEIYDLAGRRVQTLAAGLHDAGLHVLHWEGRDTRGARVPSGVYLLRLQAEGRTQSRKLTVLK